jgi:hypothetical protein
MLGGYHAGFSERGWAYDGSEYCISFFASAIMSVVERLIVRSVQVVPKLLLCLEIRGGE